MRVPDNIKRKLLWDCLFKHDGDRAKVAKELRISERTLYRDIAKLDLYSAIDKMGWSRPGPPRGMPKGSSVIRMRIIAHIKTNKGVVDYGELVREIYGQDTPAMRQRIYSALEALKQQGRIDIEGDKWILKSEMVQVT